MPSPSALRIQQLDPEYLIFEAKTNILKCQSMRQINPIVQSLSLNAWMSMHLSNKQLITGTIYQYKGFL